MKYFYFFIISLFLISFTSAVPSFVNNGNNDGLTLNMPVEEVLKQNTSYDVNVHVFNASTGMPVYLSTVQCNIHVYNSTGDHIYSALMVRDNVSEHGITNEWVTRLNSNNFTNVGKYSTLIQCNNSILGGSIQAGFEVTSNGKVLPGEFVILFFIISFILSCTLICFISLYSIGHLLGLDFDIVDLSIDLGLFLGLIALYFTQSFYLGSEFFNLWFLMLIKIGAVLLVLVPIIAFFLSITIGSINKKSANVGQPARIRWRRR